jgi:hypothetical protein
MSIVARLPDPHPTRGSRAGDRAATGSTLRPFGVLLPSDGLLSLASASTPRRALALDALRVRRAVAGRSRQPATATAAASPAAATNPSPATAAASPAAATTRVAAAPPTEMAFSREVDTIRVHLGPIRSRASLAASFEREATRIEAVRLAYAIRWLELGDGIARPPWRTDR